MDTITPYPDLLSAIEAHCAKAGMKDSTFGHVAMGDPNFVRNLRDGREPRRKTANRAVEYILTGVTWEEAKAKAIADNQSVDALPDGSPDLNNDSDTTATVSQVGKTIPGDAA